MSIDINQEAGQNDPEGSIFLSEIPDHKPGREELVAQFLTLDGDPAALFLKIMEHYPESPRRTIGELQFHLLQARGGVPEGALDRKVEFYDALVELRGSLEDNTHMVIGAYATRSMM